MAKAKKLPSGSWRVRQYVGIDKDGKKLYKSFTAETKKEAEYMAAEYMYNKKEKDKTGMLLSEAMDQYIQTKTNVLSPSTISMYKYVAHGYFEDMRNKPITDITQEEIQAEINKLAKTQSPKSVRNIHGFLSAVFREYRPQFVLTTKFPAKEKHEATIPTNDQAQMLLDASYSHYSELYKAILLASLLGLRRSEICALEWADIDFDKNTVSISKAMVTSPDGGYTIKQPKSYSGYRTVPMPDILAGALQEFREASGPVVHMTPAKVTRGFQRLCDRLGIKDITFHRLRHYYASIILALGVPDKYAMELMGHATNNMLKDVYQHTTNDKMSQVTKDINDYFNGR